MCSLGSREEEGKTQKLYFLYMYLLICIRLFTSDYHLDVQPWITGGRREDTKVAFLVYIFTLRHSFIY